MLNNPTEQQRKALQRLDSTAVEFLIEELEKLDSANRRLDGVQLSRSQGAALVLEFLLQQITVHR